MWRWGILAGAALAAVGAIGWSLLGGSQTSVSVVIPYTDSAAVELGRRVYAEACGSCHGANLEGQPNWRERRPDGRLPAPPHDQTGHTWHHVDQQLFDLTKFGVEAYAPDGYESDMPGFKEVLSDEEILASLAFIKSTWPPAIQARHDQIRARQER